MQYTRRQALRVDEEELEFYQNKISEAIIIMIAFVLCFVLFASHNNSPGPCLPMVPFGPSPHRDYCDVVLLVVSHVSLRVAVIHGRDHVRAPGQFIH